MLFSLQFLIKNMKYKLNQALSEIVFKATFFANSKLTCIFSVCLNRDEKQITTSFKDFKKYIHN